MFKLKLFIFFISLFVLSGSSVGFVSAQQSETTWSEPIYIVGQDGGPSVVVADQSGEIHFFYTKATTADDFDPQEMAVMYMHGQQTEWTQPIDILVSPIRSVIVLDAVTIDTNHYLHLLWSDTETLFHSMAHINEANSPYNWQTTSILKGSTPTADMQLGNDGKLHVLVRSDPFTVSYLSSVNGGISWLEPKQVETIIDKASYAVGGVKLALGNDGALHATWFQTAAETEWNFWSVWYGRSLDGGQMWQIREMATPLFGASDIGIDSKGNIFLVYGRNIGYPDGRWYQWSQDSGATWSQRQPLFPSIDVASGDTGGYSFGLDSNNTLHLVNSYGGRSGRALAYHLEWLGDYWSIPTLLMDVSTNAHYLRMVITQGNQLHVFGYIENGAIMYRYGLSSAPALPPESIPINSIKQNTSEVSISSDETNTITTTTDHAIETLSFSLQQPIPRVNPLNQLILVIVITLLFIFVVLTAFRRFSV